MDNKPLSFFHPAKLLGTWFGVGLSPKASGTMGSIAALPFAYVIQRYGGNQALFIASIIAFFVGWIASNIYLPTTDAKDPKEIVIDEVSGQWLLLSVMYPTFASYMIGLLLFRIFDICKPWPVSIADQKIDGGLGVMLDDILAALYPMAILVAIVWLGRITGHPFNMISVKQFLSSHYVF